MIRFERIPLLRFFMPFIAGVIFARYFKCNSDLLIIFFSLSFMLVLSTHLFYKRKDEKRDYRFRWLDGFFLSISLFLSGILIVQNNQLLNKPDHFANYNSDGKSVVVQIDDAPSERKNSIRATVSVIALKLNNEWIKTSGKLIQYFEKDSSAFALKYGDRLIQKAHFTPVLPPQNPHEFNYKNYLTNCNIFHQSYMKTNEWKKIDEGHGNLIKEMGYKAKNTILKKIETLGIKGEEFAIVTALLLGVTDNLDADTLRKFTATGTIHVLCVSGLHVGIFFVILNFLLGFLDKHKKGKFFKAFLIILLIWFYAVITGLSPSVLRASTTFSFIILAKYLNRNSNIYNTLLLSALILIIIDSNIITNLGFLLSYFAVVGIVYLYPKFNNSIKFKNIFLKYIWSLICVSLAAQVATSPLSIYYYNQFPNYFLFSNIVVVPLATLIVYSGVAFLALSFIPFLSDIIAIFLSYLLMLLNYIVGFIENLPFSTSVFVINNFQMFLWYAFLIFIIIYFEKLKPFFLQISLSCLICLIFIGSVNKIKTNRQKQLVIYSIDKGVAIDFISGSSALFIADSSILKNRSLIDFQIKGNRIALGVKKIIPFPLHLLSSTDSLFNNSTFIYKNYINFCNLNIVLINKNNFYYKTEKPINNDYIIINGFPSMKSEDIISVFRSRNFILTKNLKNYQVKAFYEKYKSERNKIYNINNSGAFTLSIN